MPRGKRDKKGKMYNFRQLGKVWILVVSLLLGAQSSALAHRPHDEIYDLKLSPDFAKDRTVYIVVRGNFLKSKDAGNSWTRITKGFVALSRPGSIAVSGKDSRVVYLTPQSVYLVYGPVNDTENPGCGIYRSDDAGESWRQAGDGLGQARIYRTKLSPVDSNIVLAADTGGGIYKTEDGGMSWVKTRVSGAAISAFCFSADGKTVFAGDEQGRFFISYDGCLSWRETYGFQGAGKINAVAVSPEPKAGRLVLVGTERGGIFRSEDAGASFSACTGGIPDKRIMDIVFTEGRGNERPIFASAWHDGCYISRDQGITWRLSASGLTRDKQADVWKIPHFTKIAVSERFEDDGTVFLAGFDGLFKSTDGGKSWKQLDTLSSKALVGIAISPDYKKDSTVVAISYGNKAYISTRRGEAWKRYDKGLETARFAKNIHEIKEMQNFLRFFDAAFSPGYASDKIIFATLLYEKLLKITGSGGSWRPVSVIRSARGMAIAVSPAFAGDRAVFLMDQAGVIYKSQDGGARFLKMARLSESWSNNQPAIVVSPDFGRDRTIFAATPRKVFRSQDGGKVWRELTEGTELGKRQSMLLAISPQYVNDGIIAAGTEEGVFLSKDRGVSWNKTDSPGVGDGHVEALAFSPDFREDKTIIASIRGRGLFRSEDGGESYSRLEDGTLPIARIYGTPSASMPLQFSPNYKEDRTIFGFGAAENAIFRSMDGGKTWKTIKIDTGGTFDIMGTALYLRLVVLSFWKK
jgi:photosystem II stability/assembly factor-like uncharacterized protein